MTVEPAIIVVTANRFERRASDKADGPGFPDLRAWLGAGREIGVSANRMRRIDFIAKATGQTVEYLAHSACVNVLTLQDRDDC